MSRELSLLLLTKAWLIQERVGTLLYHNFLTGKLNLVDAKAETEKKVDDRYQGMSAQSVGSFVYSTRQIKTKSGKYVAVMPVVGTLTKRGDMCSYGMRDYINEIAALNENEDIVAIVMDMEGPGGTVDGTNEFGLAVRNSKKPIVTFGDYMVASANYWVASQSDFIIGNKNNPTEFGSIGVLCVHEYWGKYIEDNIGEIKIIRAPQSVDKARLNPIEELTPELEKEIQEDLRGLAKDFFAAVKKGRGDKLKTDEKAWGTGRMFKLQEAIDEHGLVDAAGTLMDAINKAAELGAPQSSSSASATEIKTTATKTSNIEMKKNQVHSSFFKPKKAAKKAAEPTAEETDTTPLWTEDMIFNTDGSGDGAFCIQPDTEGNDRKFETKIDNNKGNKPPDDPAVTEDDNWSVVAQEEAAPAEEEQEEEEEDAAKEAKHAGKIQKLNSALKNANKELAVLQAEKLVNDKKKAGPETTVISDSKKESGAVTDKDKYRSSVDDEVDTYIARTAKKKSN